MSLIEIVGGEWRGARKEGGQLGYQQYCMIITWLRCGMMGVAEKGCMSPRKMALPAKTSEP